MVQYFPSFKGFPYNVPMVSLWFHVFVLVVLRHGFLIVSLFRFPFKEQTKGLKHVSFVCFRSIFYFVP